MWLEFVFGAGRGGVVCDLRVLASRDRQLKSECPQEEP